MNDSELGIRMELPGFDPKMGDRGREATRVEDLTFANINMRNVRRPIQFAMSPGEGTLCDTIRDIRFTEVHARNGVYNQLAGRRQTPLKNFVFTNCSFELSKPTITEWCEGFVNR